MCDTTEFRVYKETKKTYRIGEYAFTFGVIGAWDLDLCGVYVNSSIGKVKT